MSHVDQFESLFRAATKERFHPIDVKVASVLALTDLPAEGAGDLYRRLDAFLPAWDPPPRFTRLDGAERRSVAETLAAVQATGPDLVVTYRNLYSDSWRWPYSLGEHLDVLTQVCAMPVLVLPHPGEAQGFGARGGMRAVMALTDHLTGDDRLVSWAAHFTPPGGALHLTHIEDQRFLDRAIEVIGKIPALDTDVAREEMGRQLLKEPQDFIESVAAVLRERGAPLTLEPTVVMGRRLSEVRRLVEAHAVDLLVVNTKDDDQLAMHGLAHPLAVELRQVPMLML